MREPEKFIPPHGGYLLDQLLCQLETAFMQEGGLRERMTRARLTERAKNKISPI